MVPPALGGAIVSFGDLGATVLRFGDDAADDDFGDAADDDFGGATDDDFGGAADDDFGDAADDDFGDAADDFGDAADDDFVTTAAASTSAVAASCGFSTFIRPLLYSGRPGDFSVSLSSGLRTSCTEVGFKRLFQSAFRPTPA